MRDFKEKMHQMRYCWCSLQNSLGRLAGFKKYYFYGEGERGMGWEERGST